VAARWYKVAIWRVLEAPVDTVGAVSMLQDGTMCSGWAVRIYTKCLASSVADRVELRALSAWSIQIVPA
jgi:hypothetical protein